MRDLLDRLVTGLPPGSAPITHVQELSARSGRVAPWPAWVPDELRSRLAARGIGQLWEHQARAAEAAYSRRSVVLATGTASGKSLAYQLPALTALIADDRARVLYVAPTKALAGDQLASLLELELPQLRAATFDGDTPSEERDWVRAHANWVLTNPDMLHRGILPGHERWASYFRRLRYVVIDECHAYRGLFGSHVALVLRRLRRICAAYGATPTFVLASATVSHPERSAGRLIGVPVEAVTEDASPRGARVFALWEPPLTRLRGENGAPVRRAAGAEAGRLLADLVAEGAHTLAFLRSRRGAEFAALAAQQGLAEAGLDELAARVAAYRAGYLPEERRALEAALSSGQLLGVAATNALELGIDVAGLDAVVLAGYPGTLASLWQQAGRAGRAGGASLVLFIARDDPLDTYLVHHPDAIFGRSVEATVFDALNPYVLAPQLACAAAELPLRPRELALFAANPADPAAVEPDSDPAPAPAAVTDVLEDLVARGVLRRRPAGWYWTSRDRPSADIRGSGARPVAVIESGTGSLIGTVDAGAAHSSVHAGAVYLHQGRSYIVEELDLEEHAALVRPADPDWTTSAREITDIAVVGSSESAHFGPVSVHFGTVDVANHVVSYLRKRISTGEVLDETPLDLPVRELRTRSVWYTVDADALFGAGLDERDLPGAAHAAEHAAIGLLPLFATCDRWDIGGVSTALHPDTGRLTIFVYDGHPGGAGFCQRGHAVLSQWLAATRAAIGSCECVSGCPSCVQSPKCGNGNEPLDKDGAHRLLSLVLHHLPAPTE